MTMRAIDFFIRSYLFLAVSATLFTMQTFAETGRGSADPFLLMLVFFACLLAYNFHRFIVLMLFPESLASDKYHWLRRYSRFVVSVIVLSVAASVFSLTRLPSDIYRVLIPAGLLTLFYSVPLFKKGNDTFSIRHIPFLKLPVIALVWSLVSVSLPFVSNGNGTTDKTELILFGIRFLFIAALCIPFDVRDMEQDRSQGVMTFAHAAGERRSYRIASFLVVCMILLAVFHYLNAQAWKIALAYLVSGTATLILFLSDRFKRAALYHYGFLDGMIFLQAVLVIVASLL